MQSRRPGRPSRSRVLRRLSALHRDQRGGSTVELALVLPLLLAVVAGATQFALVQHAQAVAQSAAVEGARLAASEGRTPAEGAERTRALLEAGLGDAGERFVVTAGTQGEAVVTRASGSYPLFIPWVTSLEIPIEVTAEVWREEFRDGP